MRSSRGRPQPGAEHRQRNVRPRPHWSDPDCTGQRLRSTWTDGGLRRSASSSFCKGGCDIARSETGVPADGQSQSGFIQRDLEKFPVKRGSLQAKRPPDATTLVVPRAPHLQVRAQRESHHSIHPKREPSTAKPRPQLHTRPFSYVRSYRREGNHAPLSSATRPPLSTRDRTNTLFSHHGETGGTGRRKKLLPNTQAISSRSRAFLQRSLVEPARALIPGGPTRARSKRRGNASTRPFHPSKGLPRPIRVSTLLVVDSNSENSESQRRLHKPRGKKRIRTPCAPSGALGCT